MNDETPNSDSAPSEGPKQPNTAKGGGHQTSDPTFDLSFVPQWARKPAGRNPYAEHSGEDRGGRRPRGGDGRRGDQRGGARPRGRGPGPGARDGRRPDRGGPGRDSGRQPRGGDGRGPPRGRGDRERSGGDRPRRDAMPPRAPRAPLDISFLPDTERLGILSRDLRKSQRAYRLNELAELFLSKPEYHAVKIEVQAQKKDGPAAPMLYQCKLTRAVFLDRRVAVAHAKTRGLDEFYEVHDMEGEAPTGHFAVVARCGLSGTLLGPPNHHSYARTVQELHQERYARMPIEEYRSRIQTVRDPELIEQWKQEQCKRRVYREKGQDESGPEMTRAQAEAHFEEHHLPKLIVEGRRFIAPASVMRATEDPAILRSLREAWTYESRRPTTLLRALRPALRHMGTHIFRANGKVAFVTAVRPRPLTPDQTVQPISEDLDYLHQHPGCTRQQLVDALRPDKDPTSPEVSEVLTPLRWLIERGHVVQFSNGTLSVPTAGSRTA